MVALHNDSSAEPSPSAPTNNTTSPVGNEACSCSASLSEQISPVIHSPSLQDEQCLALVIADLSISDSTEVVLTSRWLSLIPERLSTSDALDTAVRCFAIHHLGIIHGNEQMIRCARSTYGQALTSLQKALYNPVEVMSSQTLCATSILCMYEVRKIRAREKIGMAADMSITVVRRNQSGFLDQTCKWNWWTDPSTRPRSSSERLRQLHIHHFPRIDRKYLIFRCLTHTALLCYMRKFYFAQCARFSQ